MNAHRGFRERWAAVNAVQDRELRRLTPTQRFERLVDLFEMGRELPSDPRTQGELRMVRRRWAALRRVHAAKNLDRLLAAPRKKSTRRRS